MTPTEIARTVRWAIAGFIALAAIVLGGWQAGWWFHSHNVNRDAALSQQGYANQSAMRDEITRKLGDVQQYTTQINSPAYASSKRDIEQSRSYAAMLVCGDAAQVTDGLPADQARWIASNCENGSLSPSSIYNVPTTPGS